MNAPTAAPVVVAQGLSILAIVLPVFCFFSLQLYLYFRQRRSLKRQRRTLDGLRQQGDALQEGPALGTTDDDWPSWAVGRLRDGSLHDGHFSRDNALEHLDDWLESDSSYLFLQRMQILAPLLGLLTTVGGFLLLVLTTVSGFLFLEPGAAENLGLKQILSMLMPLFFGMGSGVLLAIINQILLHLAGRHVNTVRMAGQRWFDSCVWRLVEIRRDGDANDAMEALKSMAEAIGGSVERYRAATSSIEQTCQSFQGIGKVLGDIVEHLRAEVAASSDEMKTLRTTGTSMIRSMGDIVPNIERLVSDAAEAAKALNSVARVQLGQAGASHLKSAEILATSVAQIHESAKELTRGCGVLVQAIDTNATASKDLSQSLRSQVLPTQQSLRDAGAQLAGAASDLSRQLASINKSLGDDGGAAHRAFREAANSIQGSVDGLAQLVRDLTEMTQLRQEFAGLGRSLSQAATAGEAIRDFSEQIRAARATVVPGHNGHASPRRPFLSRLLGRFAFRGNANHNGRP